MQRKYSILLLKLSVRLLERLAEAIFRQMEKDPSNDTLRSMYCIFQSIICIHAGSRSDKMLKLAICCEDILAEVIDEEIPLSAQFELIVNQGKHSK